ncbi:F-type H+-transporting ATPase alpha chain [uncultured Eubacteriales bacterium]|uniref:F-type H+-transporting ATPase alpha chain n=1 Tax=uncultured Eubacteriales bacterium TaxID=172733 RepID=A0A212IVK2_9FIRM|nr:F-type H+-transporting ATPase alpha chain [uncultured Eubacteriales bacterium]
MCKMLLSINPQHVENILSGKKQFEFRKVRCKETIDKIVIYSTAPVMRVVAEALVEDIIVGDVSDVWHSTKDAAGISYEFYKKYYKGKKTAVAYKLGAIIPYSEPKVLADFGISYPPQSFCYLSATT